MKKMIRISVIKIGLIAIVMIVASACAAEETKLTSLTFSGPPANVTYPMLYIIEHNCMADIAEKVEFVPWNNPDQLRALIAGKQVDFVGIATNVAATLYNKKVPLKLIEVSFPSNLWIVSTDKRLASLIDLKGKEVAMPFRGGMPEILFTRIALKMGLDPKKDLKLRYVGCPMDAVQLLMLGRVRYAFLAEPSISMAVHKSRETAFKTKTFTLYHSVDMQKEWGKVYQKEPAIPSAGIAATARIATNDRVIKRFHEEYLKALQWCKAHPDKTGELAARYFPTLKPLPVADAIKTAHFRFLPAFEARKELEHFFSVLNASNPAVIGGKLPDINFYWKAP
jgi:NitT/TauT family transport system substrate-binding protein